MSFTNQTEDAVLDALLGATSSLFPDPVHIGLSTTTPADDGTNFTEPVGNGYARVSVPNTGAGWDPAVTGDPSSKPNAALISFPQASGSWGVLTHFGIFDAGGGGNLLAYGALNPAKAIDNGDTLEFPAGNLEVTLD